MPSFWFKKLNSKKEEENHEQKPRLRSSWRLRRMSLNFNFKFSILENLSYHLLSAVEAVVLVLTLSCFFLCCGCHF
ncbi:uncharacterized protein LOC144563139 [Carex rostrata]